MGTKDGNKRIVYLTRVPKLTDSGVYMQSLAYRRTQLKYYTIVCNVFGKTQQESADRALDILTFLNTDFK